MFSLEGKNAFIAGGASGIGLAVAKRFLAAGATLAVSDISDGTRVADEIGVLADWNTNAILDALGSRRVATREYSGSYHSLAVVALLLTSSIALAVPDPIFFSPEQPSAGRPFQVTTTSGGCEGFPLDFADVPVRQGNEILIRGGYAMVAVGPCNITASNYSWEVDPLPVGSYELVAIGVSTTTSEEIELLRVEFGVSPNPIPSLGMWAMLLMIGATAVIGLARLR